MKVKTFLFALVAFLPALQSLYADSFGKNSVKITGNIITETGDSGQTAVKPITIKNVLSVLGLSGTTPIDTYRYYYDQTADSYVIAPKSLATTGTGTPTATVVTFNDNSYVSWNPNSHTFLAAGGGTALNADLTGTGMETAVRIDNFVTEVSKFVFYGTVSEHQTIMKATILDLSKEQPQ